MAALVATWLAEAPGADAPVSGGSSHAATTSVIESKTPTGCGLALPGSFIAEETTPIAEALFRVVVASAQHSALDAPFVHVAALRAE